MIQKLPVFLLGCLASIVMVIVLYRQTSDLAWSIMVPAYFLAALGIGGLASMWPGAANTLKAFIVGIFCGGLAVVFPVLVVTYGFAIIVLLPFVVVWSGTVLLGAWWVRRYRIRQHS